MSTPVHGDPSIDEQVRFALQVMRSVHTDTHYRNMSEELSKDMVRLTAQMNADSTFWHWVHFKQSVQSQLTTHQDKIKRIMAFLNIT